MRHDLASALCRSAGSFAVAASALAAAACGGAGTVPDSAAEPGATAEGGADSQGASASAAAAPVTLTLAADGDVVCGTPYDLVATAVPGPGRELTRGFPFRLALASGDHALRASASDATTAPVLQTWRITLPGPVAAAPASWTGTYTYSVCTSRGCEPGSLPVRWDAPGCDNPPQ